MFLHDGCQEQKVPLTSIRIVLCWLYTQSRMSVFYLPLFVLIKQHHSTAAGPKPPTCIIMFARLELWPFQRNHYVNTIPELSAHSNTLVWLWDFITITNNTLHSNFAAQQPHCWCRNIRTAAGFRKQWHRPDPEVCVSSCRFTYLTEWPTTHTLFSYIGLLRYHISRLFLNKAISSCNRILYIYVFSRVRVTTSVWHAACGYV